MLGALGNTDTRMIFGVDRYDAEYLVKIIGRVDTEAVKQTALRSNSQRITSSPIETEGQYETFSSLPEQWEQWIDRLRYQKPRQAMVSACDRPAASIITMRVPAYTATEEDIENIRRESGQNYGIPYEQAKREVEERFSVNLQRRTEPLESEPVAH